MIHASFSIGIYTFTTLFFQYLFPNITSQSFLFVSQNALYVFHISSYQLSADKVAAQNMDSVRNQEPASKLFFIVMASLGYISVSDLIGTNCQRLYFS